MSSLKQQRATFRTDLDKSVLHSNFEKLGWVAASNDQDWNFFWATKSSIKSLFRGEFTQRLQDDQMVNHFPNHWELTRKDTMAKNVKRYRKELDKEGNPIAAKDADGNYMHMNFLPMTFNLPAESTLLLEEFKRNPLMAWICKPSGGLQGKGIFIISKVSQLNKWLSEYGARKDSYVACKYVDRPLLIGGKKFDMRSYVMVTSYRPLRVFVHKEGFARFCNVKYHGSVNMKGDDMFAHLTNVAVQKNGEDYNEKHGNKFPIKNLRLYLMGTRGHEAATKLWDDIYSVYIHALKAVQNVIINDKHCFEMYGFDILIDEKLQPWLLEVNACPSLHASTKVDRMLKMKVISDTLELLIPPDWPCTTTTRGFAGWNQKMTVGGWEMIYDEAIGLDRTRSSSSSGMKPPVAPSGRGSVALGKHATLTGGASSLHTSTWR